jgi:hypothetical protein
MNGGVAERAKFNELTARIAAGNPVADLITGTAEPLSIETTVDGELPTHTMMQAVADLRAKGLPDKAIEELLTGENFAGAADGKKFSPAEIAERERLIERIGRDPELRKRLLSGDPDLLRAFTDACGVISTGKP